MADDRLPCSGHGATIPRGLSSPDPAGGRGRFGRMFPRLPVRALDARAIDALLAILGSREIPENDDLPAGYTYVAQFVDHDVTFDPSSLQQQEDDPDAHVNFRTPRLDLDSVYGSGPVDQPYLYEWTGDPRDRGVKLLVRRHRRRRERPYFDLPRNDEGRALTGDPRNDENLILAQLHLLFIHFHNKVVDVLRGDDDAPTGPALFRAARRAVRWHYQWMVLRDLLPRVVGDTTMQQALETGERHGRRCLHWQDEPFIPVEFSAAAYRFGHSMVRPTYRMNTAEQGVPIFPLVSAPERSLRGFRHLPKEFVVEWQHFFDVGGAIAQRSMAIDPTISRRLFELPADVGTDGAPSLPRLNLMRAAQLGLPAGPDVARAMGHDPLDASALRLGTVPITEDVRDALLAGAPLWFYVLAEAAALCAGTHLGPVGGRIVAEVLLGLVEADPNSYLHATPAFTPRFGSDSEFTMADLVRFAWPEPG